MKLIFMDIDNTLTIPGHNTPPESAIRAIRSAQKLGNKVLLCTGRGMCMLEELLPYDAGGGNLCMHGEWGRKTEKNLRLYLSVRRRGWNCQSICKAGTL